jgi:type II secretory pathway pseudopilin PulG
MARGERSPAPRGFTYLGLLVLVAMIGVALAAAGDLAATTGQREREAQLLWVGHQYRAAIARYWNTRRAYPQKLEELLGSEPDAPVAVRYLRRLYPDPMTNAVDWVLVPAPAGGIMGIASSSQRAPLKVAEFDDADLAFAEAKTYADWQFLFQPGPARPPAPIRK